MMITRGAMLTELSPWQSYYES